METSNPIEGKSSKIAHFITDVIWKPTMHLRYAHFKMEFYTEFQLQQLWVDNAGNKEWRKIEVVNIKDIQK